ncbi:ABC transporter ATP-binding protein/permease [Clostridium sp. CS001]|uniref:ABC transporter ATP-binding protein n=1 Tax=Clostridium sp. CS001 TaxID=2880648 RepID=UPI001CF2994F|nr:ABC transporter ATP-binding protein [Clostridium sp. CS001]MCB2288929.1 ABC transporter ATP-binding protein/permease [Clostridium sp. CS001]
MKRRNVKSKNKILSLIKIVTIYSPFYFTICLMLTIVEGLMMPFMLFTVAKFIDAAMTVTSANPEIRTMLIYLGFTVIGYLYMQLGPDVRQYNYDLLEDNLRMKFKADIIKEQFSIDYLLFEATKTQDLLLRVTKDIEIKILQVIRSVNTAISVLIQLFGVLYAVATVNLWIVFVYLFSIIPTILLTFRNGRVVYEEEKKVGFITRQMNYLSELLVNRETVNERALFGFAPSLNKRFMKAHLFRSNYNTKVLAKETSSSMMVNVANSIAAVFIIFMLAHQLPGGALSVGLFTSIVGSMISLSKIVAFHSSGLILEFSKHYEYAKDLDEYAKLKRSSLESSEVVRAIQFESIIIKDLWFRYEDSGEYILKGINLSLNRGKSYSLVGLNGAGKSTLVKIMVGLYSDYEGEILLNGKDLKSYNFGDLRSIFSVVSQDFAKYYVSLKENITFEDSKADISEVISFMELEGVVDNLPNKEHSHLGKIYEDGSDLSGGEWQRLAIARALYLNSPFMIMDEPTSSLSPTAESMIYNQFLNIANDKTLFMITHRLGSTKITDEIIVLDQGKIIEKGTHEVLMVNDNVYAQLFRKQGEMYD